MGAVGCSESSNGFILTKRASIWGRNHQSQHQWQFFSGLSRISFFFSSNRRPGLAIPGQRSCPGPKSSKTYREIKRFGKLGQAWPSQSSTVLSQKHTVVSRTWPEIFEPFRAGRHGKIEGGGYFSTGDRSGWVAQKVTLWVSGISKIFILDMFYKVFDMAQSDAIYSENPMLFDTFASQNAKRAPKVSINDRFLKAFGTTFPQAAKRCSTYGF